MKVKGLIGVIGSDKATEAEYGTAREVGALIAAAGYGLISGGLGGVMEGASKGAQEAGAVVLGMLPGSLFEEANRYVDIAIPTGIGDMRNAIIVRAAKGLVAVGGGEGTLSEIALALKAGRPVVGIDTWDVSKRIVKAADAKEAVGLLIEAVEGV